MNTSRNVSRRSFLGTTSAAAGALAVGFHIPFGTDGALAQKAPDAAAGAEINAWVVIAPDDTVTIRIARSEMGQGTLTGLAQLVADELDCDWSKVTTEYVPPQLNLAKKRLWGDMSTGGSRGIRTSVTYVRLGGATARWLLVDTAARKWGAAKEEISVENGIITHKPSGKKFRFGELAAEAAKATAPTDVKVKDPKDWKIIGKSVKRLDTPQKVNGALVYAIDVMLPDMLNAAISQSPVFGGKLKNFDADKIKAMTGVKQVVAVGDNAVAVIADSWWQAKTALDKLPIVWDEGPNAKVSSASIAEFLKEGLTAKEAALGQKLGDVEAGLAKAAKKVEAVYSSPFLNHATMEPMNCTAQVTGDQVEIWVPTQNGEDALVVAGETAGVPLANVKVNKLHLGGGFGRRGRSDYVKQAVLIAKQAGGKPVKMIWSREEDMQHGFYRPIGQCKLTGGLDDQGNLVALHVRLSAQSILAYLAPGRMVNGVDLVAFQGLLADERGYTIPNLLIDHAVRNTHVPVGFWRGVNANQNAIFVECFIDELAAAAGKDPLEFRRGLLKEHPKHLGVLNAVAEKAEWGKPAAAGVYRGLCQFMSYGSYTAAVAEVSVSDKGKLKIHRIVAAIDPGNAVNPGQIEAQMSGSFVYGLTAMLYGENTVKDGRMVESNFDSYPSMHIDEMPKVEAIVMPSGGFWGGVGEPTIAVAAPAVLNAIFAATGKRVRSLPLKNVSLAKA